MYDRFTPSIMHFRRFAPSIWPFGCFTIGGDILIFVVDPHPDKVI